MINSFSGENAFLSNFYPGDNTSLEHKFQAFKATNPIERAEIFAAAKPGQAKRLGRKCQCRPDWKKIRMLIMSLLAWSKFQDSSLRERLLATDGQELVEGNTWHDNFWGDCHCGGHACLAPGKNKLGKILMRIRSNLVLGKGGT